MWITVNFIRDLKIPLTVHFWGDFARILIDRFMKGFIVWLKFNGIKLVIALLAGVVTYHLLNWVYTLNF